MAFVDLLNDSLRLIAMYYLRVSKTLLTCK